MHLVSALKHRLDLASKSDRVTKQIASAQASRRPAHYIVQNRAIIIASSTNLRRPRSMSRPLPAVGFDACLKCCAVCSKHAMPRNGASPVWSSHTVLRSAWEQRQQILGGRPNVCWLSCKSAEWHVLSPGSNERLHLPIGTRYQNVRDAQEKRKNMPVEPVGDHQTMPLQLAHTSVHHTPRAASN